jgi:multisubunit Na+/H+ antiporter MnhB subunit
MIVPALVGLGSAGLLFIVSFGVLALVQPAPPAGTLLICAGAGIAAAATSYLYRRHWLAAGIAAGTVAAAYFVLVFITLVRREQPDVWPLIDALLVLVVALLAARLSAKTGSARAA